MTERCRVLVVDDDVDDLVLTRAVLAEVRSPACETHWARSFDEGLAALKSARHDIALVDWRLGARDGLELIELAEHAGVAIPMILLTGKGSDAIDAEAAIRGAADFLNKRELSAGLLGRAIRYALAHARREANFRALIEQCPDAIVVHRGGTIEYANPAAVDYLSHPDAASLVGRPVLDLYDPADRADAEGAAAHARGGRSAPPREARFVRSDGARVVANVVDHPIVFDDHLAVLSTARDTTAMRRLEARATLHDRMAAVGSLAAGVAHEINNPLTYVIADIELARRALAHDAADIAKVRSLLGDAADGAERVRRIVRDLRTFAHADDDRLAPIDLHAILDVAVHLTEAHLRDRARVIKEYGELPFVAGNEARACQVFVNVLLNAAHALRGREAARGTVTIRTRTDANDMAIVEVLDDGAGMPPNVLARAFDPFFTTKDIGSGMGLGLSVCHGIVTSMNGRITLSSEVGRGTTVTIAVPRATAP